MSPSNPELPALDRIATIVREIARAEILPRFGSVSSQAKEDGSLVTEADLATQRGIIEALAGLAPAIPVLGEEMPEAEQQRLLGAAEADPDAALFWALDPLDGTSNFACGFPAFATSLALFRAGRVELGVVYDPLRDECFSACRGQGAWLNDTPLTGPASTRQMADAMALMDFKRVPPSRLPDLLRKGAFRSQRNLGSVALDWCWMAAGRAQLYLHGGQRLWDYAAGHLIAAEAGVSAALLKHGRLEADTRLSLDPRLALAAANPELFNQWQAFVGLPWND